MSIYHKINLKTLYKSDLLSDVRFIFHNVDGSSAEIPGHRQILASQSTVFERMFCSDLREGPTVTIVDASAAAFAEFLQIFYMPRFQLSAPHINEVFRLIDKYDVTDIWPACKKYLYDTISVEVAFFYYELTFLFELPSELERKIKTLICADPLTVLEHSCGQSSNFTILKAILQLDLECSEFKLLESVVAWARASPQNNNNLNSNESIRCSLGDCLDLIRFPTMTITELEACAERYPGLLLPEEFEDIAEFITHGKELTVAKRFGTQRRRAYDITVSFRPSQIDNRLFSNNRTRIYFNLKSNIPQQYIIQIEMVTVPAGECLVFLKAPGCDRKLYLRRHILDESHLSADGSLTVFRLDEKCSLSKRDEPYLLAIIMEVCGSELEANMITQPIDEHELITFPHANPSFVTGMKFLVE